MGLKPVSQELIIDRLAFENPWWIDGKIEEEYSKKQRRLYCNLFFPIAKDKSVNRAVALMGPRRVGKTVMLYHTIQSLLDDGVSQKKICFINIENPVYRNIPLEQLLKYTLNAIKDDDPKGWFIFFDEIQYLKEWEVHLKVLVDSYPQTKFIVSGSAAAALKLGSAESGAGRFTDFMLPPLTFQEYLHLKNLNGLMKLEEINWGKNSLPFYKTFNIKELNKHFIDYINYGGYPEVIFSDTIKQNPGRYIRSDIVDKVLLRDLPSMYGIQDVQELNSLFTTLAYNSGTEVSLDNLSMSSGVNKNTVKKYTSYLEAAFLIKRIQRIDHNSKNFKRNNFFKIYLTNPSLRTALFTPLEPTDEAMGNMVETTIFSQWMHRESQVLYYARWNKGEVDMVCLNEKQKPSWAVEIKWSNSYYDNPQDLKSLISFCKENNIFKPLVTTIDIEGEKTNNGISIAFMPASIYAYNVGNNTLAGKALKK